MQNTSQKGLFKLMPNQKRDKNQSCPPIIQQDITMSRNQAQSFRRAKSQILGDIDKPQQKDKNNYEQKQQKIKITDKPISQRNLDRIKLQKYHGGTQFDVQKVQSDQYSIDEGSINSRSNKQQKKQKKEKEKLNQIQVEKLNVLVAGAADTGKTTFTKCFKNKQRKKQNPIIRLRTKQLRFQAGIVDDNHLDKKSYVNFIDFPGFYQLQIPKYLRDIQTYAATQSQKRQSQYRRPFQDQRIHCCLYFLQGPNIKETDLFVMNQLAQLFTLIPVIAKSDCYTLQQILEFKQKFRIKTENNLARKLLDIQQLIGQLLGSEQKVKILQSWFGKYPPFAITSSCQRQINEVHFVRKYPWGKVQIDNEQHTDFSKLSYLLTDVLKNAIISKTNKVQFPSEEKKINLPDENSKRKGFMPIVAIGMMTFCLGFFIARVKKQ